MKILLERISLLLIALCWQASTAIATDKTALTEVVQGIWVLQGPHEQMSFANQGNIGNSGFIIGEKSIAVIDPGGSKAAGDKLLSEIRAMTDLPVSYLILSHFHPDHVAAAMAFMDTPNVIAHENYPRAMTQRAQFYVDRFPAFLSGTVEQVFRPATRTVIRGQPVELDLGHRKIVLEAHAVAHTDNDLTIFDKRTNTIWASDLVFAQRTPSLDGSLKGWLNVLGELDTRRYGLTIPGHGDPDAWEVITESQKSYLTGLRDKVRKIIRDGIALSEVLESHDKLGDENAFWKLYAAQHGSNLAKAYTELEWE